MLDGDRGAIGLQLERAAWALRDDRIFTRRREGARRKVRGVDPLALDKFELVLNAALIALEQQPARIIVSAAGFCADRAAERNAAAEQPMRLGVGFAVVGGS